MKRHIPNFLTCCNLLCGVLGIIYILDDYPWAVRMNEDVIQSFAPAYFVWAACLFDFFDGFAARALNVSSPIGKELDSLADMVSFGVLPAVFMYKLTEQQYSILEGASSQYLPNVALIIAAFSALRLAIFNIDESQKDTFKGLPTPANTLFITSLPFLPFFLHPYLLIALSIICSFLLVSSIELFALKFKNFSWGENKLRFTFLIVSVLAIAILKTSAIPFIIIFYIVLSLGTKAVPHRP
jgi:CDP-diacylglycerol---serine O-phosphatidyltransferase